VGIIGFIWTLVPETKGIAICIQPRATATNATLIRVWIWLDPDC
jgi:hypothetical protein